MAAPVADAGSDTTASSCTSSGRCSHSTTSSGGGYSLGLMDLFSVQLDVTTRLLKAEQRKLAALEREIEATAGDQEEVERLEEALRRGRRLHGRLEREFAGAARALVARSNRSRCGCKSSRSQPALGLTQPSKPRATIFGSLADEQVCGDKLRSVGAPLPQVSSPPTVTMATNGFHGNEADTDALVYKDGNLVAGSLEALIRHCVPTATYYPDRTFLFAWLLSSRLFLPPHQLLARVCHTCIAQQKLNTDSVSKEKLGKFGPHLIQFLNEWTDNFPYDFRDERLMLSLRDVTQRLVTLHPELRRDVSMLMSNLLAKLSGLEKYEDLLKRIHAEVAQRLLNVMPTTDIYEVCSSPLRLAQQLTHIELERLSMIGPEEFVQAFAKDEGQKEKSPKKFDDFKRTTNLESYVQWFNRLSYFVATEICMHLKKRNRVRMIEYFIDVAKECINIGNFNSLMAIIGGLNMSSIQRLKRTWAKVHSEKLSILEHQMNPSSNFGTYRSSLKAALWRAEGAGADDRERIVIPFFSLFVKDMYFLNEGCANRLENGDVNFSKFWELAKQVGDFLTWRQVECPFDRHPAVLNYVLTNPVFSENSLALASFECEAPENSYEKDRYKGLKEQAGL